MEKNIISVSQVNIELSSLLSVLHADYNDDYIDEITTMHRAAVKIAKPIAFYSAFSPVIENDKIILNGIKFEEPFVYEMLSECSLVVPYVASCGTEINDWSKSFSDIYEQYVADVLKQLCLGEIRKKLFDEVINKYFNTGKNVSAINPGSLKEWPLSGQIPLFNALGSVTEDIGVTLSDSLLMTPNKSISGIIFQADKAFENCQLCPRINCPGRRVPYAGE